MTPHCNLYIFTIFSRIYFVCIYVSVCSFRVTMTIYYNVVVVSRSAMHFCNSFPHYFILCHAMLLVYCHDNTWRKYSSHFEGYLFTLLTQGNNVRVICLCCSSSLCVFIVLLTVNAELMLMANPINYFMDNTGIDHLKPLTHLIDHIALIPRVWYTYLSILDTTMIPILSKH